MQYEEALKEWGARRLEKTFKSYRMTSGVIIDRSTVVVETDFNEGYQCCNGRDPDCYCSFAESPSASVEIRGFSTNRKRILSTSISFQDFNFAEILKEIVEIAGGTVNA